MTGVHLSHLQRGGAPGELFVLTADAVFSVSGAGLRHEARKVLAEAGGAAPNPLPLPHPNPNPTLT